MQKTPSQMQGRIKSIRSDVYRNHDGDDGDDGEIPYLYRMPPLVPTPFLLLSFLGTYSLHGELYDVWVMWAFGLLGYVLRKTGFPLAPVVIGRVLGPILEPNFQRSMALSRNGLLIFVTRPISLTIVILTIALLVVLPLINRKGASIAAKE